MELSQRHLSVTGCHTVTIKQRGDKERRVWLEVADAA